MKLAILSATISAACAFTPSHVSTVQTSLSMSENDTTEVISTEEPMEVVAAAPSVAAINGWVPDESKPCFGLPGKITN